MQQKSSSAGELQLQTLGDRSGAGILAIDVGGSHISAAVFDDCTQALGPVGHVAIPAGSTTAEFLDAFELLCREVLPAPQRVAALAIAFPNPFDYERGISYMKHKFQQLYGVDLRQALSRRLNCDPSSIHFLNDAAAYLVGELRQGAAVGVERAVAITLGTGIGSAFAVAGQPVLEGAGVPPGGEIWNLPYLGGIVEDWAGTAAIQRLYFEATGEQAAVHEIAAAAPRVAVARETFERFGVELGKLLRFTTADFAPQRIVIGGGIARSASLFFPSAQQQVADLGIELRVSQLSDRAPLIGAAISWSEHHSRI